MPTPTIEKLQVEYKDAIAVSDARYDLIQKLTLERDRFKSEYELAFQMECRYKDAIVSAVFDLNNSELNQALATLTKAIA